VVSFSVSNADNLRCSDQSALVDIFSISSCSFIGNPITKDQQCRAPAMSRPGVAGALKRGARAGMETWAGSLGLRDMLTKLSHAQQVLECARRRLGRSLSIREVDAGSCNGCELEIHALNNAYYDVERFGLRFVASPRHADVLMVTGPVTKNMREALERTYDAVPNPKWVVAIGDCARDGGCFAGSYAVVGGVSEVVPVDLHSPGCPPTPTAMLQGLLALLERVDAGAVTS
jgi:Ni,Fe-hydrogenase III small subunit